MNKKLYWGLCVFILLIIGVTAVLLIRNQAKIRQMEADLEVAKKKVEEQNTKKQEHPIAVNGQPPAEPGFKWVRHGDHWDKVPISAPHQPVVHEAPMKQTYNGTLTYHKELLEKHPVEALRQQAREAGHWSAEHIPPFPLDDTEAAEFARELYLYRYYKWTGQTDNPAYLKALVAQSKIFQALRDRENKTPWEHARTYDLKKLTWPDTTTTPSYVRLPTTFREQINPLTARPLLSIELEMSNRQTTEND